MDQQAVFTKAVNHLLSQGQKSMAEVGGLMSCAYRGVEGRMCAVGCLITDEAYSPDLENESVRVSLVQKALQKSGFEVMDAEDENLLVSLQRIHDTVTPGYWRDRLKALAEDFDLKMP